MNKRIFRLILPATALFLLDIPLHAVPYQGATSYYLNCGSTNAFTDSQGRLWRADTAYSGLPGESSFGHVIAGNVFRAPDDILNTTDDELYQTNRWGPRLEYRFDLPPAAVGANAGINYMVKIKFSETFWGQADSRKFRVCLNDIDWSNRGYRVMDDADIFTLAGGRLRPYEFTFRNVTVNDGVLKITLNGDYPGGMDNAFVSGIEIQQIPYEVGDIGMSDDQFLDAVEQKAAQWFIDSAVAPHWLVNSWGVNDQLGWFVPEASIASIGFQLIAYPVAVHRGWMTHQEAYNRTRAILSAVKAMPKGEPPYDNPYETYWHYYERENPAVPMPNLDPVRSIFDNGDLMMGVVFAVEYFKGTEVELLGRQIFESLDWNKFGNYSNPTYSEEMIAVLLGASSPRASCRNESMIAGFDNPVTNLHDPLYFYQWINLFYDGRNTRPPSGRNDFAYAREATLTNRQDAIDLWQANPGEYNTYDFDTWGMTAAQRSHHYNMSFYNGDVSPFAIAASMPFAPQESLNAMKHMYYRYFRNGFPEYLGSIWSDIYGFCQTYNIGTTQGGAPFSRIAGNAGFDFGASVMGIQNYRDGFVWQVAMNSDYIRAGLHRIGMSGFTQAPPVNLTQYKPFVASSFVGANTGDRAFDDDLITRWESAATDPQSIYVDLGAPYRISSVELFWETAHATHYVLEVSDNATDWAPIQTVAGGDGAVDRFTFTPSRSGRYVRMRGTRRINNDWGYSLWGFRVFGSDQPGTGEPEEMVDSVTIPVNAIVNP